MARDLGAAAHVAGVLRIDGHAGDVHQLGQLGLEVGAMLDGEVGQFGAGVAVGHGTSMRCGLAQGPRYTVRPGFAKFLARVYLLHAGEANLAIPSWRSTGTGAALCCRRSGTSS